MSKRAASSELNHENWDQEDAPEEAGVFETATSDVIEKRVIRTAKRRIPSGTTSTEEKKSAFAGFTGFGLKVSNDNQFKSLTSNTEPKEMFTVSKTNSKEDSAYLSKLKGLNESFLEWIKMHIEKNPCCILTPIFRDYEKYIETINEMKDKDKDTPKVESTKIDFRFKSSDSELTGNNQKSISPLLKNSETAKNNVSPLPIFSFNSNNLTPSTNSSSTGLFKPNNSSSDTNSAAKTAGTGSFTFAPSGKMFSFGNVIAPANKDGEETNEEPDEPPKNDFKPVTEEDSVFSHRVKVFVKKDGNFSDRGVGTLYIKEAKNGKHQAIVRADTSLGNILFNILLTDAVPTQRVGKNNVMLICIPTPEAKPPPTPVLLRVKTSQDADNLLAQLVKYKK